MSTTRNHAEALALVLKAKESYRSDARKLTWEEKIASIERMRKASRIARESGRALCDAPEPEVSAATGNVIQGGEDVKDCARCGSRSASATGRCETRRDSFLLAMSAMAAACLD